MSLCTRRAVCGAFRACCMHYDAHPFSNGSSRALGRAYCIAGRLPGHSREAVNVKGSVPIYILLLLDL